MNKEQFYNCLTDSNRLSKDNIGEMNDLVNEFPYCQSARIMLTTLLYKEKDIRYEKELRTTAVYASNRGILKNRIYESGNKSKPVVLHDEHKEDPVTHKIESKEKAIRDTEISESSGKLNDVIQGHFLELESGEKPKTVDVTEETIDKKTKKDLIDQFIENEPSISRQKGTFFNPVTAAKMSITDQENIISETLAQIYLDQGFIDKAISTYKKLSLKYPEKSTYFAALIEKAEKK